MSTRTNGDQIHLKLVPVSLTVKKFCHKRAFVGANASYKEPTFAYSPATRFTIRVRPVDLFSTPILMHCGIKTCAGRQGCCTLKLQLESYYLTSIWDLMSHALCFLDSMSCVWYVHVFFPSRLVGGG